MFKLLITGLICLVANVCVFAQNRLGSEEDTLKIPSLEEVVIVSQNNAANLAQKPLSTLDEYLQQSQFINMVRRGGYAWEPYINGMASERGIITIDGMRIYAACTDKMDPVTSYVEISNLAKVNIHSSVNGSVNGSTISGTLDLERKEIGFGKTKWGGTAVGGFETNNKQRILGVGFNRSTNKCFVDGDITFRSANNYMAGNNEEVLYSQFMKYNASAVAGYKINATQHIEGSIIYDNALNVGYPALPMDVSSAKAFISSLAFIANYTSSNIKQWETKLYYNSVTHVMDDSQRPIVPIRMDMPGWSKTTGFYSHVDGKLNKHSLKASFSGHHNRSLANMTMYSNAPEQKDMFMFTWPGVVTNYADVYMEDNYKISSLWSGAFSIGMGLHNNKIDEVSGLKSLQIFYPDIHKSRTRLLNRLSASLQYRNEKLTYALGLGYSERAPSVSEGYGYYLFNSFDGFDYIGDPQMKNERSVNINTALGVTMNNTAIKLSGTYFYLRNYIIGKPHPELSAMTEGASGVKMYEQLKYANVFNTTLDISTHYVEHFGWGGKLSYRRGTTIHSGNLPLIQPFSYYSNITYFHSKLSADLSLSGAVPYREYSASFGETPLPSYCIFNVSLSQRFNISNTSFLMKVGVENILDKYYTTFSDWNHIPRPGRNVFINMMFSF